MYLTILVYSQGKFQLQMFNQAGHNVQEDLPDKMAEVVAAFLTRHRMAEGTEWSLPVEKAGDYTARESCVKARDTLDKLDTR